MTVSRPALFLLVVASASCAGRAPAPRKIDASDTCAFCRMVVSNPKVAAQIVAPGEEPRMFDDIGCVVNELKQKALPDGAVVYVADHRTGAWVEALAAVYVRADWVETPMGSHLIAFANEESRREDRRAAAADALSGDRVFAGTKVTDGR